VATGKPNPGSQSGFMKLFGLYLSLMHPANKTTQRPETANSHRFLICNIFIGLIQNHPNLHIVAFASKNDSLNNYEIPKLWYPINFRLPLPCYLHWQLLMAH